MALENWDEYSETVVNYVDSDGECDDFSASMVKKFIKQGTENPREQVRLSRTIKDILAEFTDSPLNVRRKGSRASGVERLSADLQALWAEMVVATVNDDGSMDIHLSADAYTLHTTFAGRKDDDGNPMTSWGTTANMYDNTLGNKLEAGFVSVHKGDN